MFSCFPRLRLIVKLLEVQMAQIDDLNAAVAKLQADVTALIAATAPVNLAPTIAAVQAVDATVVAATPAPATP